MKLMDRFSKNTQISNFMKIRPVGAELLHADRRTDMTKLVVAFGSFANASEKSSQWENSVCFDSGKGYCNRNMKQQGTRLEIVTVQLLLKLASIYPRYEAERLTRTAAESCAIRAHNCDTLLEVKLSSDMPDIPCFASCLCLV